MPAPASPVDICNLALDRIGQASITSIDAPQTTQEDVMARHYDQTREEILREYIFNFSRKTVLLTPTTTAPAIPGYPNVYALPADFLRKLTLGDRLLYGGDIPSKFFDISGGFIYCNNVNDWSSLPVPCGHHHCDDDCDDDCSEGYIGDDTGGGCCNQNWGLQMVYIRNETNVALFDSLFIKLLSLELASAVAYKFTLKGALKQQVDQDLERARLKAAAISGQEKRPVRIQNSRVRDVRRSGGIFRNNTIIGGGP